MRNVYLTAATLIGVASLGLQAHAGTVALTFAGAGVNGEMDLTYVTNPNTGVLPGTSPNPVDPIGSYIVTGIAGSFADTNLGINSAITGIVLSNPANPEPTNLLAPHSFGFYPVVNGVPNPGGVAPGLSYDGLYYPGGSPQTASDYPFHGGYFDIYGLVFTLANGDSVNFWSDGDMGGGASYGAAVTDGNDVLDYVGGVAVSVPEPASWALMICGLGIMGATIRKRNRVRLA
jgi:hypothetical protein